MERTKKRVTVKNRKRLKWWVRNNYIFLIIIGVICLIVAAIMIYEVSNFERTRNMEALLQKSRRDMHWGGITNQDVEILKKRYPRINWNTTWDRSRWVEGDQAEMERLNKVKAKQKLRRKPKR